jgi:hypothetical protein
LPAAFFPTDWVERTAFARFSAMHTS